MQSRIASRLTPALFLVPLLLAACDEKVVFRDRDEVGPIQEAAAGFVGYTEPADKTVVCGNCHIDQQAHWRATAHASAWATLDSVPAASRQPFCESCHSVNERGNRTEGTVGFDAVKEVRYHDVQCESCHGPGLQHITDPSRTQPLAPISVGVDLSRGCGECHNGTHQPFVEEWAESGHAQVIAYPASRPDCQGCHTGQGALRAFGSTANYLEKDSATAQPIVCAVCHNPHEKNFEGQLRYTISVADEEQNLCMRCHHKRGMPETTSPTQRPHSPEGPLLLGDAGWWPPNMPIEPGTKIVGTHGTQANPRLCAGCHVFPFEVRDKLTGDFVFQSYGHRFEATPCVDDQGAPTSEPCDAAHESYRSCTNAGCHGSQDAARSALTTARLRLKTLNDELKALLARVPPSEFSSTDNRYSTAEGARFNSQLADLEGTAAHNPFLTEALLIGSISQVEKDYGLAAVAGVSLTQQLLAPPSMH